MKILANSLILATLLTLVDCTSMPTSEALDRVHPGMDKNDVLELAGNPRHSYRSQSRDNWVFRYFRDGKEHIRRVQFENGRVVSVGPAALKRGVNGDVDDSKAENMDELENELRQERPIEKGEFQDISEP